MLFEKSNRSEEAIETVTELLEKEACADNYPLLGYTQLRAGKQKDSMGSFVSAATSFSCKQKGKQARSQEKIKGEAWLLAALAAWDLGSWEKAHHFCDMAKKPLPPYAKRGEQGYFYTGGILLSRNEFRNVSE